MSSVSGAGTDAIWFHAKGAKGAKKGGESGAVGPIAGDPVAGGDRRRRRLAQPLRALRVNQSSASGLGARVNVLRLAPEGQGDKRLRFYPPELLFPGAGAG